jgi:hypothetical protein
MNVAFLQNQWFRNPESARRIIDHHGDRGRRFLIEFALFRGCLTGRRILQAFNGKPDVRWEEASTEITGQASACPPADLAHMRRVLEEERPRIVMAFGRVACDAFRAIAAESGSTPEYALICGPHPAARQPSVMWELEMMAKEYRQRLAELTAEERL